MVDSIGHQLARNMILAKGIHRAIIGRTVISPLRVEIEHVKLEIDLKQG